MGFVWPPIIINNVGMDIVYESVRVVWDCEKKHTHTSGAYVCDQPEFQREKASQSEHQHCRAGERETR